MSDQPAPIIVMTGATSGIGRLAAAEMARRGTHLVLIARSEANAEATRTAIRTIAPQAQIDIHFADLARLETLAAVGRTSATRLSGVR